MEYRTERDFLGEREVPRDALWGIHTARALDNFAVSGYRTSPALVRAYALVKKAACLANAELGYLDSGKASAIAAACDEVASGGLADQFPVDALQGGAGTSTNMNLNEVIANRANEILGGVRGRYAPVDPLEDVNLHQSTNDTYPTALKLAAIQGFRSLSGAVAALQGAFQRKEKEFAPVVTVGRTELREAVPMTLGAEFSGFAEAFGRDRWRCFKCEERLRTVNLGGTAVGTGLTAPREYIFLVTDRLRELTGIGFSRGENLVDQTANADPFVEVSGILAAHAANLMKVCSDLRLLVLTGELVLPPVQAGSSIMPGKVNPVILELGIQAGMKAAANSSLVTEACSRGSLQINEFLPLVSFALLESLGILERTDRTLAGHVAEITADRERCRGLLERDPMVVTALLPLIGYGRATALMEDFYASGRKDIRAFLAERFGEAAVAAALSPEALVSLGYVEERP